MKKDNTVEVPLTKLLCEKLAARGWLSRRFLVMNFNKRTE